MKTTYVVFGNKKQGYRICVPTKAKMADEYDFKYCEESGNVYLPIGSLVYVPTKVREG